MFIANIIFVSTACYFSSRAVISKRPSKTSESLCY